MEATAIAERIHGVGARVRGDDRVSLSDFARGRNWRSKLAGNAFLELLEHGERTAWVVSEEGMRGMVEYIADLEEQAERASVRALFDAREGRQDWMSGASLAEAAKGYFLEHERELSAEMHRD